MDNLSAHFSNSGFSSMAAPTQLNSRVRSRAKTDTPLLFAAALLIFFLSAIIFSLSPWTHDLVDIKTTIYLVSGPLLMIVALALIAAGRADLPQTAVVIGLAGYLLVMFLSVLHARYKWAGWPQLLVAWSGAGFFMAALCCGSHRRAGELLLRCFVLMLFLVNAVGFLMFSFPGAAPHHSLFSWAFHTWYGFPPGGQGSLFTLLYTFSANDQYLISTLIGSDEYVCFCLLYFPFALLMALDPGPVNHPHAWRLLGWAAAATSAATFFYGHMPFVFGVPVPVLVWLAGLALFGAVFFFVGNAPGAGRRATLVLLAGFLAALVFLLIVLTPSRTDSRSPYAIPFDSFRITWPGALGIVKDHPLLGGGPGSLHILFPTYRNPDYHLYQLSHITITTMNYFLDQLAEIGVLGLAAFVLLLGALLLMSARWILRHPDVRTRGVLLAAAVGVLAILAVNLINPNLRYHAVASSLWVVLGFLGGWLVQAETSARAPVAEPAEGAPPDQPPLLERPWASAARRRIPQAALWLALLIFPLSVSYGYRFFLGAVYYARGEVSMSGVVDRPIEDSATRQKCINQLLQSAEDFEAAIACDPTAPRSYYRLGYVWQYLGRLEEGRVKEYPGAGRDYETGESQAQVVHYLEQSRKAYEKLARLAPDYSELHRSLAGVYGALSKDLVRQAEGSPSRAELKEEARDCQKLALEQLDRMSRLSTRKDLALFHGDTATEMGRDDRALAVFKAASDRYPDDAELAEKYLEAATKAGDATAAAHAKERLGRLRSAPAAAAGASVEPRPK